MHKSHGMGYEEYSRNIDKVIKVEKRREKEFAKSRKIVSDVEPGLNR